MVVVVLVADAILVAVAKLMAILYVSLSLSAALSPKFEGTLARKNELGRLKGFTS